MATGVHPVIWCSPADPTKCRSSAIGRLRVAKPGDLPFGIHAPHVLRHGFAGLAADLGFNEPTIASLLGGAGKTIPPMPCC
jgi:hypothetical protein